MYGAIIIAREAKAHWGGPSGTRYLAVLDETDDDGNPITQRCDLLAEKLLEQHVVLGSRRREKTWYSIMACISDALWPDFSTGCTWYDQAAAFEWLRSEDGSDAMHKVGLEQDYVCRVVTRLSQADEVRE